MEENNTVSVADSINNQSQNNNNSQKSIAGAIILAGILIAGAILLKGNMPTTGGTVAGTLESIQLAPVTQNDRALGNNNSKITLVLYEDFQCPFCGRFENDTEQALRKTYVQDGRLQLVYRDFAFLGPESVQSAEAGMCASEQGKFWPYHDYLFTHQNGENKGAFSDTYLKSFAKTLGLNTASFNQCLDSGKYAQFVADAKSSGNAAGVSGTPKGFLVLKKDISSSTKNAILQVATVGGQVAVTFYKQKNIVSLDGALPSSMVTQIVDLLLKN